MSAEYFRSSPRQAGVLESWGTWALHLFASERICDLVDMTRSPLWMPVDETTLPARMIDHILDLEGRKTSS